jgi:hypothetical protein
MRRPCSVRSLLLQRASDSIKYNFYLPWIVHRIRSKNPDLDPRAKSKLFSIIFLSLMDYVTSWIFFWRPIKLNQYLLSVLRIRIRDPVPFWPLDPGSGLGFFRIPDPRSRIPNPYFWELGDNFLGKKFYNSLKIGPNFFLQHFRAKIIFNFVKFVATWKNKTTNFFSSLSFVAVFGSGIRDG